MRLPSFVPTKSLLALTMLIVALLSCFSVTYAINSISTGYQLTTSPQDITGYGTCYRSQVTGGNPIFFPTQTQGEWNSFVANKPASVSLGACTQPCSAWRYVYAANGTDPNTYWYVLTGQFARIYWDNAKGYPLVVYTNSPSDTSYNYGGYRYEKGPLVNDYVTNSFYYIRRCPA